MSPRLFTLLLASLLLTSGSLAQADDLPPAPPTASPSASSETAWIPHVGVHITSGFPQLTGVALSLRWPKVVTVDGGAWAFPFIGSGWYVRAGYPLSLHDGRGSGTSGWTIDLPLSLGVQRSSFPGGIDSEFLAGEATVGIDATRWVSRRFGFNVQVSGGPALGRWVDTYEGSDRLPERPEFRARGVFRVGLGLVF